LADSDKQSFWTTLPGVLTGIAALLTAATGLLVVVYPHGGAKENPGARSRIETAKTMGDEGGTATPPPIASPQQKKKPAARLTAKDGTETRVSLNSFRDSYSGESLQLKSGQSIPFEKIKSIDFLEVNDYQQDLRVTLTDGRAVDGSIMSGEQIMGNTDIGPFSVSVKDLKRISFER